MLTPSAPAVFAKTVPELVIVAPAASVKSTTTPEFSITTLPVVAETFNCCAEP